MAKDITVLAVDDHAHGREILRSLLSAYDYNIVLASNGLEALARAKELTPDIILLDVMMPDMDGFEVCRRLRTDPLLAEVPVVMVTALDDRNSRIQGIQAGADDFIVKPFDPTELLARVKSITRLNRYRRLLQERAKFKWVVEQADDGYIEVGEENAIIYANQQARHYLGLPLDEHEMVEDTFINLVSAQYNCEPQELWESWPEQTPNQAPRYLIRPDSPLADPFWLQVDLIESTSPSGERFVVRLRDITAEIKAQRDKWTFQAQVSHKLRTPLALLTGFLSLLEDELPHFTDDQRDLLRRVLRNAMKLQDEIVGIFRYMEATDIVRPGQGNCCVADLEPMVRVLDGTLNIGNVAINLEDIYAPETMHMRMSSGALELILYELMENAKKFHPEQTPTVQIQIAHLRTSHNNNIRIQVIDDGRTLSPQQLSKIWLPYYQAEKYFTGQVKGMGLGLAMVATLMWEVGGKYRMYNRPDGVGVIVELTVPVAP